MAVAGYPRPIASLFGTDRNCWTPIAARDSGALEMAKALAADYREQIVERVNQALVFAAGRRWTALRAMLIDSLHAACAP